MAVITAASDPQPSGASRPPPVDEGVVREREGEGGEACEVLARAVRADEVGGDHHGQWRDVAVKASGLGGGEGGGLAHGADPFSGADWGADVPEDGSARLRAEARVRSTGIFLSHGSERWARSS